MQHIRREIQIVAGKGPAHIIIVLIPGLGELLELGHDQLIAALAVAEGAHLVVDLRTSVQAQHHIAHLPVAELHHLVVQQHAVGGQGETELLVELRLLRAPVLHQALHHIPVHQRLAPEEVHLQMLPAARIGDQEIQGLFAHLVAHQSPPSVVLPFLRKAILAGQVAVVGDMQAQRLDHSLTPLKIHHKVLINIPGQKLFQIDQLLNIFQGLLHIVQGITPGQPASHLDLDLIRQLLRPVQLRHQL